MTTHFVTVPLERALQASSLSASGRLRPLALVAHEDPMIADSLAAILDVVGLAVLTAPDGYAALETARIIPPEILIADLMMTGMTGLELARHVTRFAPDCGVILFVGNSAFPDLNASMRELGCDFRILFKPVHPANLHRAVIELLGPRGHQLSVPLGPYQTAGYEPYSSTGNDSESLELDVNLWHPSETPTNGAKANHHWHSACNE
jgi:DNA-binding response OmpR family regulator